MTKKFDKIDEFIDKLENLIEINELETFINYFSELNLKNSS